MLHRVPNKPMDQVVEPVVAILNRKHQQMRGQASHLHLRRWALVHPSRQRLSGHRARGIQVKFAPRLLSLSVNRLRTPYRQYRIPRVGLQYTRVVQAKSACSRLLFKLGFLPTIRAMQALQHQLRLLVLVGRMACHLAHQQDLHL